MKISSVFSYYGGKSKIVGCYPPPLHRQIIEPFAGAAAYAWRYADHDVWINDLDDRTFSIWNFLTSADALRIVNDIIPPTIRRGMRISDMVPRDTPLGLVELMRAEANQGTQGARGVHDQVTSMAEKCWVRFLPKMKEVIPRISHWRVTNLSYDALPEMDATWFVDPPYANNAGSRYRLHAINYIALSAWCQSRVGQVIVCENDGASWLPFVLMEHRRVSIRSRYQLADAKEVVYIK